MKNLTNIFDYTTLETFVEMSKKNEVNSQSIKYEYTNKVAVNYLWPIIPSGFLILGTIANILSIIVFTRKEMKKFSSFCYFAVLNAVNLAVLYVTLIRVIMDYNFNIDIRSISLFTCKLHVFLTYFLGHLSSLMLSVISIDRVISVMFLHKAKDLCTPRVAFIVTLFLVMLTFIVSSHFLVLESGYYNAKNNGSTINVVCDSKEDSYYGYFLRNSWKILDMVIYAFIPFIIMLTCSVIIIARVALQSKKFDKKYTSRYSSTTASTFERKNTMEKNKSLNEVKISPRTRNLALMLIPVNILFLMFLAPVVIAIYFHTDLGEDQLTLAIVEFLSYCNFTLNFFIYFFTSSKFREEFFKFLNESYSKFRSNNTEQLNIRSNRHKIKNKSQNKTQELALLVNSNLNKNQIQIENES